jgi:DnaJ-class molecular chaperone
VDDLYTLLGVAKGATQDQIKSAYRKLARRLHPDLNPGNKQTEEKFKKISAAYDILGDATKRARYDAGEIDASGAERPRPSYRSYAETGGGGKYAGGFHFNENVDDIFSELLRRRDRGRNAGGFFTDEDLAGRGADAQYSLRVDFPEAVLGATKRITLPTGKHLDVKVPAGTKDGSVLRLKGQGGPGRAGGPAGDALIEMKVAPHPFFSREGDDVLVTLPITLPEAVLGGKVTVATVDGRVAMTVPPNSSSGAVLRLKGKGIPNGKGRGDQLVTLKVMLPESPDPELEAFVRSWAVKHPYDVRGHLETSSS